MENYASFHVFSELWARNCHAVKCIETINSCCSFLCSHGHDSVPILQEIHKTNSFDLSLNNKKQHRKNIYIVNSFLTLSTPQQKDTWQATLSLEGTQTLLQQVQRQNSLASLNNEAQMAASIVEMGKFFPLYFPQDFTYVPQKKAPCAVPDVFWSHRYVSFYKYFPSWTIIAPPGSDLLASLCIVSVLEERVWCSLMLSMNYSLAKFHSWSETCNSITVLALMKARQVSCIAFASILS